MITRLRVKNFRSLADVDVELGPLTVLAGQNGSGKSSLIDVLRFVQDALRLGLKTAVTLRSGMSALRRWSAKGRPYDIEIGLEFSDSEINGSYSFTLGSERRGEYRVKAESCSIDAFSADEVLFDYYEIRQGKWEHPPAGTTPTVLPDTLALPLIAGVPSFKNVYDLLIGMSFYTIFPRALREHQAPLNPYPLEEDASNLASAVDELHGEAREKFRQAIQYVIPDIKDYQVRQAGRRLMVSLQHPAVDIQTNSDEGDRVPWFDLAQESDGTLRMFALLVALHQEPPRTLIAIEEPELTVHPGAMARLWDEIVEASTRSQILMTTHSPDLLDLCSVDQLRIVEKERGITYIGEIASAQKAIIRDHLFTPGQLLQSQGLLRDTGNQDDSQ